jgi:hypothetical protein
VKGSLINFNFIQQPRTPSFVDCEQFTTNVDSNRPKLQVGWQIFKEAGVTTTKYYRWNELPSKNKLVSRQSDRKYFTSDRFYQNVFASPMVG